MAEPPTRSRNGESDAREASTPISTTLQVRHQGISFELTYAGFPANTTVGRLQNDIETRTLVPPGNQRLSYRGRLAGGALDPLASLEAAGLRDGAQLMLIGSTAAAVAEVRRLDAAADRRHQARELARSIQPLRRGTRAITDAPQYTFERIEALSLYEGMAGVAPPSEAHALLTRVASDPGVVGIMHRYRWGVGLLTELAPGAGTGHRDEGGELLLGLNTNAGQAISLRLRTGVTAAITLTPHPCLLPSTVVYYW